MWKNYFLKINPENEKVQSQLSLQIQGFFQVAKRVSPVIEIPAIDSFSETESENLEVNIDALEDLPNNPKSDDDFSQNESMKLPDGMNNSAGKYCSESPNQIFKKDSLQRYSILNHITIPRRRHHQLSHWYSNQNYKDITRLKQLTQKSSASKWIPS